MTIRTLEAAQPPIGCTAAIAGRPHRQVLGRLGVALAVHSAGLGARRILVESCAQDAQDLAALTGALPHIGAPTTVRARVDRPHTRELRWAADLIAYADTAGGQRRRERLAGHRGAGAVDKRTGRASTHTVRAPGPTFLWLFARTPSTRAGHSPRRPAPHLRHEPQKPDRTGPSP